MYYIGTIPAVESDVFHYGRLGMKWYQHIYTNPDGSPKSDKDINDNINTINKSVQSGGSTIRSASSLAGRSSYRKNPSKKVKNELAGMSDEELRKRVNRMNLERQYRDLTGDTTRRGAEAAKSTLETVGDIVGVMGGALSLALLIGKLKTGNG